MDSFLESCFPRKEGYDGKTHLPSIFADIKDTMETSYVYISWNF